jgi:hypothetical protein
MLLPNEDLARAMADRTRLEAERRSRDRGFRGDVSTARRAAHRTGPTRSGADPGCGPCPSTERAHGVVGS